ncbi:hypothetical protein FNF31_03008 [Cafeteria roenbergensis]|uniref:Tyrosine-protein kinase ephrin type A/B receptor-like domain-containing protein n=1 Tax=Cafeteria roenbergensis TaxID=33653 RepID=A0A5A8DBJ8_CAFRO|nr:hypothetical protein FNF31_03008 [Cafeteria roenbergensis]
MLAQSATLLASDLDALQMFYAASNADVSAAARSVLDWDLRAAHPCSEWSGLTCVGNHSFLRVAALNLTSKGRAPQGALTVRLEHLCALDGLASLDLSWTAVIGGVPTCFSTLANLSFADLGATGVGSRLFLRPLMQRMPDSLRTLLLYNNPQLYGSLSSTSGHLPASLRVLSLSDTPVDGFLSPWLESSGLESFSCLNTRVGGQLPAALPPTMKWLALGVTHMTTRGVHSSLTPIFGAIPQSYCQMKELEVLVLRGVCLGGAIPDCGANWTKLRVLDLSFSFVGGELPASAAEWRSLEAARLSDNLFTGLGGLASLIRSGSPALAELVMGRNLWGWGHVPLVRCALAGTTVTATPEEAASSPAEPRGNVSTVPWDSLAGLPKLRVLDFGGSGVADELPFNASALPDGIEVIDLRNSRLAGPVPLPRNTSSLKALSLRRAGTLAEAEASCSDRVDASESLARLLVHGVEYWDGSGLGLCGELPVGWLSGLLGQRGGATVWLGENQLSGDVVANVSAPNSTTQLGVNDLPLATVQLRLTGLSGDTGLAFLDTSRTRVAGGVSDVAASSLVASQASGAIDVGLACSLTSQASRVWDVSGTPVVGSLNMSCLLGSLFSSFAVAARAEDGAGGAASASPASKPRLVVDDAFAGLVRSICGPAPATCFVPWNMESDPRFRGTTTLTLLDLRNFHVEGDAQVFLDSLCLFAKLSVIRLVGLGLKGRLPPCLSGSEKLSQLSVAGNLLSDLGRDPSDYVVPADSVFGLSIANVHSSSSVSRFPELKELDASRTPLVGSLGAVMSQFLQSPKLASVDLSGSSVSGRIDELTDRFRVALDVSQVDAAETRQLRRIESPGVSARMGGPTGVDQDFGDITLARSLLRVVYDAAERGLLGLQSLNLAETLVFGALPKSLPVALRELNLSSTSVEGQIHRAFAALDVLDARACPLLHGPPLPPFGADATLALPAVLRPFWTDQAVRERLGDCCGLSDFMAPAVSPVYETVPGAAPEGFDGEVECRAVYSPANPGLQLFITPEYDNWARARCKKGSFGFGRWCSRCPTGSTTASAGAQTIDECECEAGEEIRALVTASAGAVPSSGQGCAACPVGTFRPAGGGSSCSQCPGNATTAEAGSVSDRDCECEAGFEPEFATNATLGRRVLVGCRPCAPMWTKADRGNGLCRPCAAGWYSLSHGSVSCEQCAPDGVLCPGDGTLSFLPGFWVPGSDPAGADAVPKPGGPLSPCPNHGAGSGMCPGAGRGADRDAGAERRSFRVVESAA